MTTAEPVTGTAAETEPSRAVATRRPGGSTERRRQVAGWLFLIPVVLYLCAFYAYPLYRNVDLSLRDYTVESFVSGHARFNGLDNFRTVLSNPIFTSALWHTFLFTVVSVLFQYAIGLALAVFFYQHFRLSGVLRALLLVPWLLPLIVTGATWSWMLNSESGVVNAGLHALGISNVGWTTSTTWSLWSVIIANIWIGIPFNLVLLYSGLQNISIDVYEASSIDGANAWQRFWRITFPLLRSVSAITILLGLVYTLKVFDIIWIMTRGGPSNSSTTLATWSYQLSFGNLFPSFGPGAAAANLLIVIALILGGVYLYYEHRSEAY